MSNLSQDKPNEDLLSVIIGSQGVIVKRSLI